MTITLFPQMPLIQHQRVSTWFKICCFIPKLAKLTLNYCVMKLTWWRVFIKKKGEALKLGQFLSLVHISAIHQNPLEKFDLFIQLFYYLPRHSRLKLCGVYIFFLRRYYVYTLRVLTHLAPSNAMWLLINM